MMDENAAKKAFSKIVDPLTPNDEAGIALKSLYDMLIGGEFTEDQALTLIAKLIVEQGKEG